MKDFIPKQSNLIKILSKKSLIIALGITLSIAAIVEDLSDPKSHIYEDVRLTREYVASLFDTIQTHGDTAPLNDVVMSYED